jgi:hypothetical protein
LLDRINHFLGSYSKILKLHLDFGQDQDKIPVRHSYRSKKVMGAVEMDFFSAALFALFVSILSLIILVAINWRVSQATCFQNPVSQAG